MESRKRPLADNDDVSISKKRILTGANGSPQVNGHEELDDSGISDKLELYRKEAIWRRMKHYAREYERSTSRIQELERRNSTCEAGLAAITSCWAQIIEAIRSLVKPDDLSQINVRAGEILDLTTQISRRPVEDLSTTLSDTVNATQGLLRKFVQLKGDGGIQTRLSTSNDETECIALRSELTVLRSRLVDCEKERDRYHTALIVAENKFDRSQSTTVRDLEANMRKTPSESAGDSKEEPKENPPSPVAAATSTTPVNGSHDTFEADVLRAQVKAKEQKIIELEREAAVLRDQKNLLEVDLQNMPSDKIRATPVYTALQETLKGTEAIMGQKDDNIAKLETELANLQDSRASWEQSVMNAAKETLQDLKTMVSKRDAENVRLREQREQQTAELNERKQRDSLKINSIPEMKKLLENNRERVRIFKAQLARYQTRLAASAGDEDLLRFLLSKRPEQNVEEDFDLVKAFREQAVHAEQRIAALEETLSQISGGHPDLNQCLKRQTDAFAELSAVKKELARYQQTYGESSRLPADVSQLAVRLKSKESEIEKLRLAEFEYRESEQALFAEIERLSTAWEEQERDLKERAFNLASIEERVVKISNEKAKSDNKFFAIMREKEAGDNERQKLAKTVDKQEKAISRMQEADGHGKQQMNAFDHEIRLLRKKIEGLQNEASVAHKQYIDCRAELDMERKRFHEANNIFTEREKELHSRRQDLRNKEDELLRLKKELERQLADAKRATREASSSKSRNLEANMSKDLERVAFCSTCRSGLRSTIITKCMHTFCRDCVDARLQTRQRKCPCCNLAFGQADVQTFFFN